MIRAFSFLLICTIKNMALARSRRLRQPKYLLSALAGLAYFYFFLFRHLFAPGSSHTGMPPAINPDFYSLAEVGFAVFLLVIVLLPWLWPGRGGGVSFTEAEIQYLFPAPISRRSLLSFRLAKGQIGIIFGTLVTVLVFGRGQIFVHKGFLLITLWLVYSFLSCYKMASSLAKASLFEHGISGLRRQIWILGLVTLTLLSIAVWLKWFIPDLPSIETVTPQEILRWINRVADSGPARYFLWPFRVLLHPAFAGDVTTFFLRLFPALVVLAAAYLWAISSDARFEEAAIERAEKVARKLEAIQDGRRPAETLQATKSRRPPFALASQGLPHVAFFWKNMIATGRSQWRILLLILVVCLAIIGASGTRRVSGIHTVLAIIGTTTGALACFVTAAGPLMVRDDLRSDLLRVDLIKTYPISGQSVVLGEVLAPAVILALLEWALIVISTAALPGRNGTQLLSAHRLSFGSGAAILFPCISLNGLLIQNASTLLFPGWMQLGKDRPRGIEATGRRLLNTASTAAVLLILAIPAGLAFAAVFFLGYWLIGLEVVPIAALAGAGALLAEARIALAWMGRLFDRFDPSAELDNMLP